MANYFVVGGDNKEYGPVTEADIRQWIAEGRLNAESRVKAESDAEYRRLALFPEFAPALMSHTAPAGTTPVPSVKDVLERDYELDIGGCIGRGWEIYKGHFGVLFGSLLIALLIPAALGAIVNLPLNKIVLAAPLAVRIGYGGLYSAALTLLNGPLMGGAILIYLKTIRGQATGVGEVFAGFQRCYLQLFLGSLMLSLITFLCMLPFQFVWQSKVGPLMAQMQHMQSDPTGIQNLFPQMLTETMHSLPVCFICLVPVTFFTVCFLFTIPLIIDKEIGFAEAMSTSWHMVLKHWWVLFGFTVVSGLVVALGVLGCCIGVLFTAPIGLAAMMYAYETIFGAPKS